MRALILLVLLLPLLAAARVPGELASLPAGAQRLDVAVAELLRPQDALALSLPGDRRLSFRTRVTSPEAGMTGVRGRSAGSDRLMLFAADGRLFGEVHASGGHYRLAPYRGAHYWIPAAQDPRLAAPAEGWERPGVQVRVPLAPYAAPAPVADPKADGLQEIDLLVVYTPLYESRLGGKAAARAEIQRLVFVANGYHELSGIPVRYRLVGAEKYTGTSETSGLPRNLSVTAREPAVRAYRNRIGADLVIHLRTAEGCSGLVGLSRGFNNFTQTDPPESIDPDVDGFAAAAMGPGEDGAQCPDWVFAHELGHNLAGGHHWVQHQGDGIYWKPYSHGWQCGVAGADTLYSSVMTYMPTGIEGRGDFFSSPELSLDGMPCGTTGAPLEAVHADNARAMREAAPYVAAYKPAR